MNHLQEQHKKDFRSTTTQKTLKSEQNTSFASASHSFKREDLTGTLRQQLLHRFKLFAIKLKHENMNRENGDFYEQCFNFMGNLILSNIQGVNKEMFSIVSSTSKPPPPILKTPTVPALPTVTIKREDGNLFVKKFSCTNCDATFPSLRHLERHSVQHTGEKPHICEVSVSLLLQSSVAELSINLIKIQLIFQFDCSNCFWFLQFFSNF